MPQFTMVQKLVMFTSAVVSTIDEEPEPVPASSLTLAYEGKGLGSGMEAARMLQLLAEKEVLTYTGSTVGKGKRFEEFARAARADSTRMA